MEEEKVMEELVEATVVEPLVLVEPFLEVALTDNASG